MKRGGEGKRKWVEKRRYLWDDERKRSEEELARGGWREQGKEGRVSGFLN